MNDLTDQQLLGEYAERRSEGAFTALVRRHIDLVYSVAFRMTGEAQSAQDVTQAVFMALAQNAVRLTHHPVLSGWLHATARNLAANNVRSVVRRQRHEQEAATMNALISHASDASWAEIAPHLDAALGELTESDRDAVILRFFEKKTAAEMAAQLGISDDAAQKRVSRAVEKLREYFSKRKITVGVGGLIALISANAVQSAPIGLAVTISAAAIAGTAVTTSTIIAATTKTIAMTTLQKTLVTATVAVLAGAGIYQAKQAHDARAKAEVLLQQQALLAEQVWQLQTNFADATNRLADLLAENARLKSNPHESELLKLRGEVGMLRQQLRGLPSARADLLKRDLEQMPDKKIPELKFLTDTDWINVAWNADLETDDGIRVALSKLRDMAVDRFFNLTRPALKKYLAFHDGVLPANLTALKPFYDTPVSDEMLQRYVFLQTGKISEQQDTPVVKKAVYADPDYDSDQEMSMSGGGGGAFNHVYDAVRNAVMLYAADNSGQMPGDASQLSTYLKRTVEDTTIQKYLNQITADVAANPLSFEQATILPALKAYEAANNGQYPQRPLDLLPYATTPEQRAALQKLKQQYPNRK